MWFNVKRYFRTRNCVEPGIPENSPSSRLDYTPNYLTCGITAGDAEIKPGAGAPDGRPGPDGHGLDERDGEVRGAEDERDLGTSGHDRPGAAADEGPGDLEDDLPGTACGEAGLDPLLAADRGHHPLLVPGGWQEDPHPGRLELAGNDARPDRSVRGDETDRLRDGMEPLDLGQGFLEEVEDGQGRPDGGARVEKMGGDAGHDGEIGARPLEGPEAAPKERKRAPAAVEDGPGPVRDLGQTVDDDGDVVLVGYGLGRSDEVSEETGGRLRAQAAPG